MPLGKEVGLGPGHIVFDGDPVGTQPPTAAPPHFRPMSIVVKRSPISATAELLLKFENFSGLKGINCVTVPNYVAIRQTVGEIWRFFSSFQDERLPPSWIFKI